MSRGLNADSGESRISQILALPATQITSCIFGGQALDRMFVTSAAVDCGGEKLAGSLFEVDSGVRGIAPNYFGG